MERRILYLDPDSQARQKIHDKLDQKQYEIELTAVESTEEAEKMLQNQEFDVLITEYELPEGNAGDMIELLDENSMDTVVVIFSDTEIAEIDEDTIISSHAYHEKQGEESFGEIIDSMNYLMRDRSKVKRPKPENEDSRLEAIDNYDMESMMEEDSFDRLTRIGAELFDVKFCFVGIVGEEQEDFMSFTGADTEHLERDCTICTFTINDDEVMEVENTQKDPRFKYVDELHDLGIKWYAGAPLITDDGYRVGSFCVADPEKKEFTEKERELLNLFAEESMEKIESNYRNKSFLSKLKSLI